MIVPVIIAGGKGLRLWPMSREALPKPFIPVAGRPETLLQGTFGRLAPVEDLGPALVVCNGAHEAMLREQAAACGWPDLTLLLEPEGRSTGPALCAAALAVERLAGPDAILLALPSDHAIADEAAFAACVAAGADLAARGHLVTFAVKPTEPATGYGYLRIGDAIDATRQQFRLAAFVEKPDRALAEQFLASGGYAWNSGIFMFAAATLIEAFRQFAPDILAACRAALPEGRPASSVALDPLAFGSAPSISIDYAIMERAGNVATVLADFRWSDVGDWNAVWQEAGKDDAGVAARGDVLALDCARSLVQSSGPLLVGIGLQDMVAVATPDAILVAPRSKAQEVKWAVDQLAALGRPEAQAARRVSMPWGSVETVREAPSFRLRQISVNPGAEASFAASSAPAQWVCITGEGRVLQGETASLIVTGGALAVAPGNDAWLANPGSSPLQIVEVLTFTA